MADHPTTNIEKEKAVLIGIIDQSKHMSAQEVKEHLDELDFLALTAGAQTVKQFTQKLEYPNPQRWFIVYRRQ